MKKLLTIILAASLITCSFSFMSGAEVLEIDEFTDDGNEAVVMWDSVRLNDTVLGIDGHPLEYLEEHSATLAGPAETLGVAGWVGSSQQIKAFGYMIDGGEPVLSADFINVADPAVVSAAQSFGCEFASRYHMIISTEGIEGIHKFTFLCQVEDGSIFIMATKQGDTVEFDYSSDGPVVTPEPTDEPEPGDKAYEPGPIFRFDDDDKYVEGGIFGSTSNIDSIEFDAEKKCYVLHMENIGDPWAVMQFTLASLEDDNYLVDADTYKFMQLGIRLGNPSAGLGGQIYYQTDENPGFGEQQVIPITYKDTEELQYVNVNMGKRKNWTGVMIDTRLDPLGECNGIADYELYYVAFFENEKAAVRFGDNWLEKGDEVIPTSAPTPTKAPTPEPTEAPEITASPVPSPVPTGSGQDEPSPESGGTDSRVNDGKGNKWLVIAIAGGIVLIAAASAVIITAAKKKNKEKK